MNELQKEIYTHVAIYNDGVKDYLTEKEYTIIFNESSGGGDGTWIKGKYVRFSNIARIIGMSEYKEKYQKELPAQLPVFPYERLLLKTKTPRVKAIQSLIKGIKRYIGERTEGNAYDLMKKMEKTLEKALVIET